LGKGNCITKAPCVHILENDYSKKIDLKEPSRLFPYSGLLLSDNLEMLPLHTFKDYATLWQKVSELLDLLPPNFNGDQAYIQGLNSTHVDNPMYKRNWNGFISSLLCYESYFFSIEMAAAHQTPDTVFSLLTLHPIMNDDIFQFWIQSELMKIRDASEFSNSLVYRIIKKIADIVNLFFGRELLQVLFY
jgi:hypothetical protein